MSSRAGQNRSEASLIRVQIGVDSSSITRHSLHTNALITHESRSLNTNALTRLPPTNEISLSGVSRLNRALARPPTWCIRARLSHERDVELYHRQQGGQLGQLQLHSQAHWRCHHRAVHLSPRHQPTGHVDLVSQRTLQRHPSRTSLERKGNGRRGVRGGIDFCWARGVGGLLESRSISEESKLTASPARRTSREEGEDGASVPQRGSCREGGEGTQGGCDFDSSVSGQISHVGSKLCRHFT